MNVLPVHDDAAKGPQKGHTKMLRPAPVSAPGWCSAHPRLRPFSLLLIFLLSALVTFLHSPSTTTVTVSAQLSPVRSPTAAVNLFGIEQMAYDPTNSTLYMASYAFHMVLSVPVSADTFPSLGPAPVWDVAVVAGNYSINGLPSPREVPPMVARFDFPSGIAGWPSYAVGPAAWTPSMSSVSGSSGGVSTSTSWVGLWVCDSFSHAMRFINFGRGNNVTLVAGASNGAEGIRDGIGSSAQLTGPWHITWGRFLMAPVSGVISVKTTTQWTSVIMWTDEWGHCIRQGIPLHSRTMLPLDGSPTESLEDMVLNVTTFAGLCSKYGELAVGWAYQRSVLYFPWGIALADPFPTAPLPSSSLRWLSNGSLGPSSSTSSSWSMNSTVVMFIGENYNNRLAMITPMYPPSSRYLTSLFNFPHNINYKIDGVTIGRMTSKTTSRSPASSARSDSLVYVTTTLEVFIGTYSASYFNITTSLRYHLANGSISLVADPPTTLTVFYRSAGSRFLLFVPTFAPNSSYNGTLVVFSGHAGVTVQYSCCLGLEYSQPMTVDGTDRHVGVKDGAGGGGSPSVTPSKTHAVPSWQRPTWSITFSHQMTNSRTQFGVLRPPPAPLAASSSTKSASLRMGVPPNPPVTTKAAIRGPHTPTRIVEKINATRYLTSADALVGVVSSSSPRSKDVHRVTSSLVAWSSLASTTSAVMVPGAATKASVAGRVASVWWCDSVGPSEAAADDPQQFLNFGLAIGGDVGGDGGAGNGLIRGALIITSFLRLGCLLVLTAWVHYVLAGSSSTQRPTEGKSAEGVTSSGMERRSVAGTGVLGILVAIATGYFTPNVVGLLTAVFFASFSSSSSTSMDMTTKICAVLSLVAETAMVIPVVCGVCHRGGPTIRSFAREYIDPIRRRRRWYYRVAGLEDLRAACLIAVCSNLPLSSSSSPTLCRSVAWALFIISALHLLYVLCLRPYRSRLDNGISIFLSAINAAFSLLCCVVARGSGDDSGGVGIVTIGLECVTAGFYLTLVVSVAVTVWEMCRGRRPKS